MPAKTGASHAIASFFTIILGAFLSNYISAHSDFLWGLTRATGEVVTGVFGLSVSGKLIGIVAISTGLSFLWGVAYHFSRHGRGDRNRESNRSWHE